MIKVYELRALQNNYIVSIPFKGVTVRCEFKDGNIAKGIHARLFTNDKFKQMAIEHCELNGRVWKLVETVKEPEDEAAEQRAAQQAVTRQSPANAGTPQEPANVQTPASAGDDTQEPAGDDDGDAGKSAPMEFANLAEAILYVAANYGQQVESAAQARQVLKDNGIKAVIHNG